MHFNSYVYAEDLLHTHADPIHAPYASYVVDSVYHVFLVLAIQFDSYSLSSCSSKSILNSKGRYQMDTSYLNSLSIMFSCGSLHPTSSAARANLSYVD